MNTVPSHLVINAAIEKKLGAKYKLAKSAFLWSSVTPDLPLLFLSIGYFIYYRLRTTQGVDGMINSTFDNLYFNNHFWIAGHNFLHSPTALIIYIRILWRFVDKVGTRGHWWLSFVFGCMVYSVIDLLTHFNDGRLLFFPLDWHTRFHSPISYWDTAHYASQFFWLELGINAVLLGYLFVPKLIAQFQNILD